MMIQITPHMKILVCTTPIDFRKGMDGFAAFCRNQLECDPHKGTLFLFRSRSKKSIRILVYDGQGFWLCTKRLSTGRFHWWPSDDAKTVTISSWNLQTIIGNGDPVSAKFSKDWQQIAIA